MAHTRGGKEIDVIKILILGTMLEKTVVHTTSFVFFWDAEIVSLIVCLFYTLLCGWVIHLPSTELKQEKDLEEKKHGDLKEKEKCNSLQEKTSEDGDRAGTDLFPNFQLLVAEHEANLRPISHLSVAEQKLMAKEIKTKLEEAIKSATDKCKKELEEKAKKKKSKYHNERRKWEDEKSCLWAEIGKCQQLLDHFFSTYYQYGTNPYYDDVAEQCETETCVSVPSSVA